MQSVRRSRVYAQVYPHLMVAAHHVVGVTFLDDVGEAYERAGGPIHPISRQEEG